MKEGKIKQPQQKKELLSKYVSQHPNCIVLEKFGTTIVYDKAGNIVREINKDAENEVKEITKYIYDEKGNLIKVEHPEV